MSPNDDDTPTRDRTEGRADKDRAGEDVLLAEWCGRVADALEVHGLTVDLKAVLGLAGRAAHAVMRPAAPLTTFVVGYAAGLAVADGADSDAAVDAAVATALRLCRDEQSTESEA